VKTLHFTFCLFMASVCSLLALLSLLVLVRGTASHPWDLGLLGALSAWSAYTFIERAART
jgi:hypothetical protein